jgi:hypothetical protein
MGCGLLNHLAKEGWQDLLSRIGAVWDVCVARLPDKIIKVLLSEVTPGCNLGVTDKRSKAPSCEPLMYECPSKVKEFDKSDEN